MAPPARGPIASIVLTSRPWVRATKPSVQQPLMLLATPVQQAREPFQLTARRLRLRRFHWLLPATAAPWATVNRTSRRRPLNLLPRMVPLLRSIRAKVQAMLQPEPEPVLRKRCSCLLHLPVTAATPSVCAPRMQRATPLCAAAATSSTVRRRIHPPLLASPTM